VELLSGKSNTNPNYLISNPAASKANAGIIDYLVGIFFLSDEEKLRAGIYVGAKGRDWIERSALIIPFTGEDQDIS
jgi:hypothetical protein